MLKQHLQFKLSQKLSPQQIQLMKLIQLPTLAFEQKLKQELEENPALESGKEETDVLDDVYGDTYDDSSDSDNIDTSVFISVSVLNICLYIDKRKRSI